MKAKGRAGFTLIELLVVIAIIAILAAILFPIFKEAKISAKCSVCVQHQRELGIALCLYADDNSGTYPYTTRQRTKQLFPAYPDGRNTTISGELIVVLYPYCKNRQVHYCSMVDVYSKYFTHAEQSKLNPPFMYTGYYYYGGEGWAGIPTKQKGSPKRILLSCIGGVGSSDINVEGSSGHGKARGVFIFADGHANYLKHYNYPYNYTMLGYDRAGDPRLYDEPKLLMPRWTKM